MYTMMVGPALSEVTDQVSVKFRARQEKGLTMTMLVTLDSVFDLVDEVGHDDRLTILWILKEWL